MRAGERYLHHPPEIRTKGQSAEKIAHFAGIKKHNLHYQTLWFGRSRSGVDCLV